MPFKDPKRMRAYQHAWYLEHRTEHLARNAKWRKTHPERVREVHRAYRLTAVGMLSDMRKNRKEHGG